MPTKQKETPKNFLWQVREYEQKTTKKDAAGVVFFFCPYGIKNWQLAIPGLPIWQLVRQGYKVVSYSYDVAIANHSPEHTLDGLDSIITDVEARISELGADERVICFGASMGTVLAANVAARQPRVKDVILNLSYSDIAQHIFRLPAIPVIPRGKLDSYIKKSGGAAGLHKLFDAYSPLILAPKLKGKHILLYLTRGDRLLQFSDTKTLADAFKQAGATVQYHEAARGSHYMTALYNYLRPSVYLKFLEKSD